MKRVGERNNGRRPEEEIPSLEAVFAGMEGGGPSKAERRWMNELRAQLGRDPGDPVALQELEGPRFRNLCETLGVAPNEGRERLFGSLPRSPSPASRPAVDQDPPPPDDSTGRPGATGSAAGSRRPRRGCGWPGSRATRR